MFKIAGAHNLEKKDRKFCPAHQRNCRTKCLTAENIYFQVPKLVSNGIVEWNLGTKQKVASKITPINTIVDEFGTSLILNFGKANYILAKCVIRQSEIIDGTFLFY